MEAAHGQKMNGINEAMKPWAKPITAEEYEIAVGLRPPNPREERQSEEKPEDGRPSRK